MVYHNEEKAIIKANMHPSRFFFTTYVHVSHTCWCMFNATLNLFKTEHYTSFHWTFTQFVFFPILRSEHFFFAVFQFADKTVNIIDNLMLPKKPITRYGNCDTLLDNMDLYDCEIHTMRHMKTYYSDLQSRDHVFQKEKEALLRILRAKYAARILLDPDNLFRDNTLRKAKVEARVREQQQLH
ncbi:hypothetical protein Cgig2_010968 [Carnegiea gigantea]|uniref:Ubiquitin-like protease family profile domain-containing protein n=1 Tax=Carnegiea gigantea TaxID=171969 RepID=A0A9Q1GNL7_9CARY|nr:hypothetical protein Cgig2_010968 [Carnegiea gigantea]